MASKKVMWEGDSLDVLKTFPEDIRQDIGGDLRRLQLGILPLDSKPMKSIGAGVFELRDRDKKTWYRVIYYIKVKDVIYVLHSFTKKSAKTPKNDLNIAEDRLKAIKERIKEEKKNVSKKK